MPEPAYQRGGGGGDDQHVQLRQGGQSAGRWAGTVQRTTTNPLKGTASFAVPNANNGYGTISFTNQDEVWVTAYVRFASVPGSARVVRLVNDSSGTSVTAGNLAVSSGKLVLRNSATTIGTGVALAANTTYRVGLHQQRGTTSSNAVLDAYLAVGDAAFGAPFASSSNQNLTTPAKRVEVGATNSVTLDATFDDIAVDTGSLPGPSAAVAGPALARVDATAQPIVTQAQAPASITQAWGAVASHRSRRPACRPAPSRMAMTV